MLSLLGDLIAHKGHANATMLKAIRSQPAAMVDFELWELLHHILLANRFWLLTVLQAPFDPEHEAKRSRSFDESRSCAYLPTRPETLAGRGALVGGAT